MFHEKLKKAIRIFAAAAFSLCLVLCALPQNVRAEGHIHSFTPIQVFAADGTLPSYRVELCPECCEMRRIYAPVRFSAALGQSGLSGINLGQTQVLALRLGQTMLSASDQVYCRANIKDGETGAVLSDPVYFLTPGNGSLAAASIPGLPAIAGYAPDPALPALAVENGGKTFDIPYYRSRFTVTFDANGGESAPAPLLVKSGETVVLPEDVLSREDHLFMGWSKNPNAALPDYAPGQTAADVSAENGGNVTLYAVWEYVPARLTLTGTHYEVIRLVVTRPDGFTREYTDWTDIPLAPGYSVSFILAEGTRTWYIRYVDGTNDTIGRNPCMHVPANTTGAAELNFSELTFGTSKHNCFDYYHSQGWVRNESCYVH